MVKKTREEKLTADERRTFYQYEASSLTPQEAITTSLEANNALIWDLRKTAILTGLIIAFQFFLFLALRNKVIVLPGITY